MKGFDNKTIAELTGITIDKIKQIQETGIKHHS